MDLYPKFIIEDNNLILSKVGLHKDLATNPKLVIGGGWFRFDIKTKTFTFSGDSTDFGKASLEDIKDCIDNDKVYTNPTCLVSIAKAYNFAYFTGSETIPLN